MIVMFILLKENYIKECIYEQDYLNSLAAVEETKYLRHVHFEEPIVIKMDGKKKIGVVLKPEK